MWDTGAHFPTPSIAGWPSCQPQTPIGLFGRQITITQQIVHYLLQIIDQVFPDNTKIQPIRCQLTRRSEHIFHSSRWNSTLKSHLPPNWRVRFVYIFTKSFKWSSEPPSLKCLTFTTFKTHARTPIYLHTHTQAVTTHLLRTFAIKLSGWQKGIMMVIWTHFLCFVASSSCL